MGSMDFIIQTQKALKLICDAEDELKEEGLNKLQEILVQKNDQLVEFGYDQVIFKELIKMVQYGGETVLEKPASLLEVHYFKSQYLDELAETFIYRFARSSDPNVCKLCLEKISSLIDCFDASIGKHSKQLLKLTDLNDIIDLNPIILEILTKMKAKLPNRRDVT